MERVSEKAGKTDGKHWKPVLQQMKTTYSNHGIHPSILRQGMGRRTVLEDLHANIEWARMESTKDRVKIEDSISGCCSDRGRSNLSTCSCQTSGGSIRTD